MSDSTPAPAPTARRSRRLARIALGVAALALGGLVAAHVVKRVQRQREFQNTSTLRTLGGFYHLGGSRADLERGVDAEGIRVVDYGGTIGVQRAPTSVAQYVLTLAPHAALPAVRERIDRNLEALLAQAELTPAGNLLFPFRFDWPHRNAFSPWASGMTQGQAASALLWGHRIGGDARYLRAATQAVLALREPEQGFLVATGGGVWIKEYPHSSVTVLDGCLAALAGVYDLSRALPADHPQRPRVERLLAEGLVGFRANAERFASRWGGHYYDDLGSLPYTAGYHSANLAWLDYLAGADPELKPIRAAYEARAGLAGQAARALYSLARVTQHRLGLAPEGIAGGRK